MGDRVREKRGCAGGGSSPMPRSRRFRPSCAMIVAAGVVISCLMVSVKHTGTTRSEHTMEEKQSPLVDLTEDEKLGDADAEDLKSSWLAARKGFIQWGGLGPRPPEDDHERRLAEIPLYDGEEDIVFFSHIHKTSGTSLSVLLSNIFPRSSVVPSSHPYMGLKVPQLTGHSKAWWQEYKVMYSHNRPNITDDIGFPPEKPVRLVVTVRNPLLHKASIYFESVCRYGLHIKDGHIDQEEATLARVESKTTNSEMYNFCRDPELWVGSPQFNRVYRNFQANWLSYGSVDRHPCILPDPELNQWRPGPGATGETENCDRLEATGKDQEIWEEYFDRTADAAIRRLESALWVGVTERMNEAVCLLFMTLDKPWSEMGKFRLKEPRPISVWGPEAVDKVEGYDEADWRVFEAANNILDLRLWTARERLKSVSEEQREKLGACFDVLLGDS